MSDQLDHENHKRPDQNDKKHSYEEDEVFVKQHSFSALKVVLITLGVILMLGMSTVGVGAYYVYNLLQPVQPDSEELVEVNIPMGSSGAGIASILEENGLIHNSNIFYYYIRYKGASNFQAGDYQLSPSMELDDFIDRLQEGRIYVQSTTFTIPEGQTVEQIADRLANQGIVDRDEFLRLINEGDFTEFDFIYDIPNIEEREYRLEGFLFPETYEVAEGVDERQIIRTMLSQFEREFKQEWQQEMEALDMTLYEMVTLASIVEREAVLEEERKTIAGVFHNRLDIGMKLQSCATLMFFLEDVEDIIRLTFAHLEEESPYNTYIHEGLPPGPIASPGRSAMESTVFPAEHEYIFFVIRDDGTRGHYFAVTYQEHLANNAASHGNLPAQ